MFRSHHQSLRIYGATDHHLQMPILIKDGNHFFRTKDTQIEILSPGFSYLWERSYSGAPYSIRCERRLRHIKLSPIFILSSNYRAY